jgi:drug/metabolite transporter (DMT)-like permease
VAAVDRPGASGTAARTGELPGSMVLAGLVVGVLAVSSSPILVRVGHLPALALAFWRCLAGAAVLAPFALRSRRGRGPLASREAAQLSLAGALLAVHFALFNASLSLTTVASSVVLVSCSPLFVGLGARLAGESPSRRGWLGVALATAGAVVVGLGDAGAVRLGGRALLGDAMAFAGAAAIAGYLLIGRSARQRLPLATYAAGVYGTAALVLLPACLLAGARLGGYRAGSWLVLAGVVVGPQLLGHTVFNGLLSTVTASVVAVVILLEPVAATLLAWALFAEVPSAWFWFGAPLVLAGVWLAATGEPGAQTREPAPRGLD